MENIFKTISHLNWHNITIQMWEKCVRMASEIESDKAGDRKSNSIWELVEQFWYLIIDKQ